MRFVAVALLAMLFVSFARASTGNAFAYLDEPTNPWSVGRDFPKVTTPQWVGKSVDDYLVLVDADRTVRALVPDLAALTQLPVRGVIVTARSDDARFDFVSRVFAPAAGVDEDPVTGSAHCTLTPFWAARLEKDAMVGWQASARGGRVAVVLRGDRVGLGGRAVTVLRGELL